MADLPDLAKAEVAIIEQTNAFRRAERLGAVKPNAELTVAARRFAAYLAKSGKFAHEADGRQPAQRVKEAGYKYCMVAENLAMHLDSRGFTTSALATKAVEGWKGSPGHRKNLVQPRVTDIGVGVARAPDSKSPKFLSVQLFGRPESANYTFRVENKSDSAITYSVLGKSHSIDALTTVTHSACAPTQVALERAGSALFGTKLDARYEARDGAVYTVLKRADGKVRVDVGKVK